MSYSSEVLADSPVAYYRMQEASGLIQDSSGNANHADASTGTAGYEQLGPIVTEPSDVAIDFTGDDWFSVPDHSTLDVGDTFTIEWWIKRTDVDALQMVASKGTLAWTVGMSGPGVEDIPRDRAFLYDAGGFVKAYSATAITDTTTWHHIAITSSGATKLVYVDGVDDTVTGAAFTFLDNAAAMTIGSQAGSFMTDALLDEIAIYATALSAARVQAHYEAATVAAAPPTLRVVSSGVRW